MESREYTLSFSKGTSATFQSSDNTQRHQVFRTRCTISEVVCKLHINGGSCSNLASSYLVERLNLSVLDHPNPYHLKWLNDNSYYKVEKQVWVNLSIGNVYKDRVLCDVLPMNTCHLLLGRPWEFDRGATRNGRLNTYSFIFEGRKLTLIPLPPIEERQVENFETQRFAKGLTNGEPALNKETEKYEVASVAAPKQEHGRGVSLTPLGAQGMLREQYEEAPSELPPSLPPFKKHEHYPNLVSRTMPPNKPITTTEPQEQNRKHVMDKSFVERSLGPYAVSAFLAQEEDKTLRPCNYAKVISNSSQQNETQLTDHPEGELNFKRNDTHLTVHANLRSKSESANLKACVLSDMLVFDHLKGLKPHRFTPHFHYYMLIKLMGSLAHLGATTWLHELNIGYGIGLLGSNFRAGTHRRKGHEWGNKSGEIDVRVCVSCAGLTLDNLKGFKPHHFTPHFHHYTLIKLMTCLVYLGAIAYIKDQVEEGEGSEVLGTKVGADQFSCKQGPELEHQEMAAGCDIQKWCSFRPMYAPKLKTSPFEKGRMQQELMASFLFIQKDYFEYHKYAQEKPKPNYSQKEQAPMIAQALLRPSYGDI